MRTPDECQARYIAVFDGHLYSDTRSPSLLLFAWNRVHCSSRTAVSLPLAEAAGPSIEVEREQKMVGNKPEEHSAWLDERLLCERRLNEQSRSRILAQDELDLFRGSAGRVSTTNGNRTPGNLTAECISLSLTIMIQCRLEKERKTVSASPSNEV